ncbi:unnamed protein product, partial [Mesorhabditis belari]|uniref:Rolling pebbles n=1 Tax=Mesorhabditis belari TaxID=2138241 RepID=A0AAF3EB23_9BILA
MEPQEGLLRRSLRRMNPFKTRIFRLPATPRLTRSRKIGSGCEDATGWNFERTQSLRDRVAPNPARLDPPTSPRFKTILSSDSLSRASSSADYQCVSESFDLRRPPRGHDASPPPDPIQAETSIARHMHSLLSTQERNMKRTQRIREKSPGQSAFLQLPITKYTADGQISEAFWENECSISPNISTISLLNVNTNPRVQSIRSGSTSVGRSPSLRSTYPINGLFNRSTTLTTKDRTIQNNLPTSLFTLNEFYSEAQLEEPFLGREWVFRELYEHSVMEKTPIVYIEGGRGAGKSAIINQIIMHSSFYKRQASDTLDSGCEPDAPHYEWLKAVAARLVAYHVCSIQSASSCSIPEFVCNLGATLARSPVLRSYADILSKNTNLQELLKLDECLRVSPKVVFQKAIAEPLSQLASSDEGCLVILIDGLDEAEFHRSEAGHSIARFLEEIYKLLPSWIRLILTADTDIPTKLKGFPSKSVKIDDSQLDERVMRDTRMLAEYRVSVCGESLRSLRRTSSSTSDPLNDFIDHIVSQSCGNLMYVSLLLSLAESDLIRLKALTSALLPTDLDELYLLYFNLTFNSLNLFSRCAPILSVLMASLKCLTIQEMTSILNISGTEITEDEINSRISHLTPFVSQSSTGKLSLRHASFREWLHRSRGQCRYTVDPREGHLLLAVWLARKGGLSSTELFDLAHHLLKSNPHKYFPKRPFPELAISRDCQIAWLETAAENIQTVLLNHRNILYPNIKVSRLLLLSGALANPVPAGACKDSLLTLAASAGDPSLVSLLIQYGAEVNPSTGSLPVVGASGGGHIDVVQLLHQHGALQGEAASLAIMEASKYGHLNVVSFLFECDWHDVEAKHITKQSALEEAAKSGSLQICEYLIDGAEPHSMKLDSALKAACLGGRADVVQFFLSRGVRLSSMFLTIDQSPLLCAVESGSWDLVVAVLSQPDCNFHGKNKEGQTSLHRSAIKGHVGLMDLLIKKGLDIDASDLNGWNPLMHAIANNHLSCVQLLLDKQAKLDLTNEDDEGVMHVAARYGNRGIMECLLSTGISIEDKDAKGDHPIETGIRAKNTSAVAAMLRRGARLRSNTWLIAKSYHPQSLVSLLKKLLDDAALLYKKKKIDAALERLCYAQEKCDSLFVSETPEEIIEELKSIKWQILLALSRLKRRQGALSEAIQMCEEAAIISDSDDALFEVILFRAKCHFDNHDLERARCDAKVALQLSAMNEEAKQLLATLTLPPTSLYKV